MQRVDFFRLDRPIQERFIAAAHGSAPPLPLAVSPEPLPRAVLVWGGVSAGALLGLIVLAAIGFGDLRSSLALHPRAAIAAYAALGALLLYAAFRAYQVQRARHTLPFAPGVYVFPSGLIDTRGSEFVVRPLGELADVSRRGASITLVFQDSARFGFRLPSPERAADAERAIQEFRQKLGPDIAPVSARELALLDPLCDNGFKNPFSPTESMLPPRPRGVRVEWLLGVVLGAAFGLGVWALRNTLAEQALYRSARGEETLEAYRAYVARGGRRPEVSEILLPRAELALATAKNSAGALEAFAASHRDSKIAPEIESALQRALFAELEIARRAGTLSALKQFQKRYAQHASIAPEIERAITEYWQSRLAAFQQSARPKPEVLDFFRRLLAYCVEHGSRVELRFRRRLAESVARAETVIGKSLHFGGQASLPAQYFDARHAEAREKAVADELLLNLGQTFPKDLIDFQLAAPVEEPVEDLPKVSVPTLLVSHRTEMSGAYLMKNPRAALTGVSIVFKVTFQIPSDPGVHGYKYSSWSPPDLKNPNQPKRFEELYDEMAAKGFKKLSKKYLAELLPGLAD